VTPLPQNETWHNLDEATVLQKLATSRAGLSSAEQAERRKKYGSNALPMKNGDTVITILFRQFQSPLIYLLICAALIMIAVGDTTDALIIGAVLLINAIAGAIQAGRAQNTLRALQKMTKTNATVLRDNKTVVVDDIEVVPGDIIFLSEGDKVPAGARLLEVHNLRIDESALTGESQPVSKRVAVLDNPTLQIAEQRNMIFRGTFVVAGSGTAVVIATGLNTVMGKISQQMLSIDTEIPLQKNLRHLSHIIIYVVLAVSAIIFTAGIINNEDTSTMFSLAVAVIVSAVPEGLPIVLTLLLASGVWRMSKKKILVKRLQAVEALGGAKIIAVDKTGTITKNELALTTAFIGDKTYTISGVGYDKQGEVFLGEQNVTNHPPIELHWAATVAALSSTATLSVNADTGLFDVHGDPTEAALTVFAQKLGLTRENLLHNYQILEEIPFDSALRFHALKVRQGNAAPQTLVAGAPEQLLNLATKIHQDGIIVPLNDNLKTELLAKISELSSQALRVIALAEKSSPEGEEMTPETVKDLTLIGLVGMQDGLRTEVAEAMRRTNEAGIKVVMITGDHKDTARAIATNAGIFKPGDTILTNDDLDRMTEAELSVCLATTTVFARITPEHKLSIVQAFRKRGDVIAMTGDGVNDALSLVAADLGVAMGKRGTEVAKEAADLVLLDDNFGNIVSAIEEGRAIYANLKKVLLYLFSTGLGEITIIFVAVVSVIPNPVLAVQLIWINLVTDGVLDIALAMEPKEKGLLQRPFHKPKYFFDNFMLQRLVIMSSTMAIVTLAVFVYFLERTSFEHAAMIAVCVMVVTQWFKAWTCRSDYDSVFNIKFTGNPYLLGATVLAIGLQLFAMYNPFMQGILNFAPITITEWLIVLAAGSLSWLVDELRKLLRRRGII